MESHNRHNCCRLSLLYQGNPKQMYLIPFRSQASLSRIQEEQGKTHQRDQTTFRNKTLANTPHSKAQPTETASKRIQSNPCLHSHRTKSSPSRQQKPHHHCILPPVKNPSLLFLSKHRTHVPQFPQFQNGLLFSSPSACDCSLAPMRSNS